jgi:hypothetical protein
MNHTSPTYKNASTDHITDQSTTSRSTNTTEHYSRSTNTSEEPRTTATRSKDSHRCITIRRWEPASSRLGAPLRVVDHSVDLCKIVSVVGWSVWC